MFFGYSLFDVVSINVHTIRLSVFVFYGLIYTALMARCTFHSFTIKLKPNNVQFYLEILWNCKKSVCSKMFVNFLTKFLA